MKTWAPKLMKKDGSGNVSQYAFAYSGANGYIDWSFQSNVWGWGGSYSNPDFSIHIGDQPAIDAATFARQSVTRRLGEVAAERDQRLPRRHRGVADRLDRWPLGPRGERQVRGGHRVPAEGAGRVRLPDRWRWLRHHGRLAQGEAGRRRQVRPVRHKSRADGDLVAVDGLHAGPQVGHHRRVDDGLLLEEAELPDSRASSWRWCAARTWRACSCRPASRSS